MSAEARMAASKKGYKNGLGAMSAKERMAASEKGSSNNKMGIAWEKKYAKFESYDGMPERGTTLYDWQENQLGNRTGGLNAEIREERAENKGSTIWSERRVKLSDCFVQKQKNRAKMGIVWEKKFAEFVSYHGMPERGTTLYNWQSQQLSSTHVSGLNAKIREENEENEGSTIWSERRVKLSDCVEQKNHTKIAWEKKFAEFVSYNGMPVKGTKLYTWQLEQLSTGAASLNAKIRKELAENKGSIWSERRVKLSNCVEQKRDGPKALINIA